MGRRQSRRGGWRGGSCAVEDLHQQIGICCRAFGTFRGEAYFGIFDLQTGHPTAFELPKEGERIYLDNDDELLVVQHGDRTGSFTLLNAVDPTPKNARVFNDIFLADLFEQELP